MNNKLTKAQRKRFDEKFKPARLGKQKINPNVLLLDVLSIKELKQYLAEELVIQKKEILEELEKIQEHVAGALAWSDKHKKEEQLNAILNHLDQAIKTIK